MVSWYSAAIQTFIKVKGSEARTEVKLRAKWTFINELSNMN